MALVVAANDQLAMGRKRPPGSRVTSTFGAATSLVKIFRSMRQMAKRPRFPRDGQEIPARVRSARTARKVSQPSARVRAMRSPRTRSASQYCAARGAGDVCDVAAGPFLVDRETETSREILVGTCAERNALKKAPHVPVVASRRARTRASASIDAKAGFIIALSILSSEVLRRECNCGQLAAGRWVPPSLPPSGRHNRLARRPAASPLSNVMGVEKSR